jgi:hypothetical protein
MFGLMPTDAKNMAREIEKIINRQGVTESTYEDRLKKQINSLERMRQSTGGIEKSSH